MGKLAEGMTALEPGPHCTGYCGGDRPSVWESPAERRVTGGKVWQWCKCCEQRLSVASRFERAGATQPPAVLAGFKSVQPLLLTCRTCNYDLWWAIEIIPDNEKPTTLDR